MQQPPAVDDVGVGDRHRHRIFSDVQHIAGAAPRQQGFIFGFGNNKGVPHQETANAGEAGTAHAARYSAASRSTRSATLGTSWMVAMP